LSLSDRGARVLASDRTARRVELVRQRVQKLGLLNVDIGMTDLLAEEEVDTETANVVLVDAPCSGFGTVAKKIEARWNTSAEELCALVEGQSAMLSRASKLVAPAGALVYSTCSIDWAENEGVIKRFLVEHPEFSVKRADELVSERLCTAEGYLRTWPHRHEMTGAFAAILIRKV
jgi:16S rRNA (cytosine967-C5)-methyltransferase